LSIDGELSALSIQDDFDIFTLEAFAHFESLAEQMDIAIGRNLPDEDNPPPSTGWS
jgi:hypothetical protein